MLGEIGGSDQESTTSQSEGSGEESSEDETVLEFETHFPLPRSDACNMSERLKAQAACETLSKVSIRVVYVQSDEKV
jgi:hypothetical protein